MKIDFDPKKHIANLDNPSRRLGFDRVHDFDWSTAVITEDVTPRLPGAAFCGGRLSGRASACTVLYAHNWRNPGDQLSQG